MTKKRFGVVAVVPFWSQAGNLNADSNYSYLRTVLPRMVEKTDDTVFLMFFPDPTYGKGKWKYTNDNLQSDRIKFVSWPYDTQMATGIVNFDSVRWGKIDENHAPVIYWLNQVESGVAMRWGYAKSFNYAAQPSMIAQHHFIIHDSLITPFNSQFTRNWLQMGGSLASDAVVYNSDYCRNMSEEVINDQLSAQNVQKIVDKSITHKFGLISGDEPRAPKATKENKPVILYNHRFEAYKMPQVTFEIIDKLRTRFDFEVWATQTAGQRSGGMKSYHYDRSVFEPSREDYLKRIAVPGINTINSVHETFCISMLDSICVGQLPVAPNAITFPELVPDNYPYLFDNEEQQFAMLSEILETWPKEYNRWRVRLQDHARKKFDLDKYVDGYLDIFDDAERVHRNTNPKAKTLRSFDSLIKAMKSKQEYSPMQLLRVFNRESGIGRQAVTSRRIVRELITMRDDIHVKWNKGVVLWRE